MVITSVLFLMAVGEDNQVSNNKIEVLNLGLEFGIDTEVVKSGQF